MLKTHTQLECELSSWTLPTVVQLGTKPFILHFSYACVKANMTVI